MARTTPLVCKCHSWVGRRFRHICHGERDKAKESEVALAGPHSIGKGDPVLSGNPDPARHRGLLDDSEPGGGYPYVENLYLLGIRSSNNVDYRGYSLGIAAA